MASEILLSLPAPAMERILSFFDSADYAVMAQTCNSWRRIVYRKSLWDRWNTVYRPNISLLHTSVPKGARHVGAPSKICFLAWLQEQTKFGTEPSDGLSVVVRHIGDHSVFLKAAYGQWKRARCPCTVLNHHKIYDLLRLPMPASFTKTDQRRILCRLIKLSECARSNAYSHYLYMQHQHLIRTIVMPPLDLPEEPSDPFNVYCRQTQAAVRARNTAINALVQKIIEKYTASSSALARRGKAEFENNDRWYETEHGRIWDTAGFTYKKHCS